MDTRGGNNWHTQQNPDTKVPRVNKKNYEKEENETNLFNILKII